MTLVLNGMSKNSKTVHAMNTISVQHWSNVILHHNCCQVTACMTERAVLTEVTVCQKLSASHKLKHRAAMSKLEVQYCLFT